MPYKNKEDQAKALPFSSVIVIIVLLKEDTMCATPDDIFFLIFDFFLSTILIKYSITHKTKPWFLK